VKEKLIQVGFGAFLLLFMVFSTASAASFEPDSWTKTGQGTTAVTTTSDGDLNFSYNLYSSSIFQGQWWSFDSTAESSENLTFDWSYNAFHSWYQAVATVYAYAEGPNGRQLVNLYDGYGQITTSGTTSLTLTEGYKYGFMIYGKNYDGTMVARGNLTIDVEDTVTPTTVLTTTPNTSDWAKSDVQVTLQASDNGSGVANTFYSVNGQVQTGSSFVVSTEGQNLISYWSVDNAGNVEAEKTVTVNVDKTNPTTTLTTSSDVSIWNNSDVEVTLTAADSVSGVANTFYTVNGGEEQIGSTFVVNTEGKNTISYWSVDKAGNVEAAKTGMINLDKSAPVIKNVTVSPEMIWPANHKMVKAKVSVDFTDSWDSNASAKIVKVSSSEAGNGKGDGNTELDWSITGDLTVDLRAERSGKGEGRIYTITVECTDASGNVSSSAVTVAVPHDQGKKK